MWQDYVQQEARVIRKVRLLLIPAALGLLIIISRWPDMRRYLKTRQLSQGNGHPQNVPLKGTAYPQHPGGGKQDGTGDFDSASRAGPAKRP